MLRIRGRVRRPCIRCGKFFEKMKKRQMVCPACRREAYKHGGETRQKQYQALGGSFKYFGIRKVPTFSIPKIGPLN
jgi:DNA-directed RNA polymerase subunit RPC12/RpoP